MSELIKLDLDKLNRETMDIIERSHGGDHAPHIRVCEDILGELIDILPMAEAQRLQFNTLYPPEISSNTILKYYEHVDQALPKTLQGFPVKRTLVMFGRDYNRLLHSRATYYQDPENVGKGIYYASNTTSFSIELRGLKLAPVSASRGFIREIKEYIQPGVTGLSEIEMGRVLLAVNQIYEIKSEAESYQTLSPFRDFVNTL